MQVDRVLRNFHARISGSENVEREGVTQTTSFEQKPFYRNLLGYLFLFKVTQTTSILQKPV